MSAVGNVTGTTTNQVAQSQTAANNVATKPEEQKQQEGTEVQEDQFIKSDGKQEKSPVYSKPSIKPNMDRVNELKAELKNNIGAFKMMTEKMQGSDNNSFFPDPTNPSELREWVAGVASGKITYDSETIDQAKEAISEDGEWGVEAVSNRIVDFAKAISGGDIDQYDKLLDAIKKGFGDAKEAWGKDMPDITKQTYDKTMEKMEAWKNEATAANTTTQDAVKAASGVSES